MKTRFRVAAFYAVLGFLLAGVCLVIVCGIIGFGSSQNTDSLPPVRNTEATLIYCVVALPADARVTSIDVNELDAAQLIGVFMDVPQAARKEVAIDPQDSTVVYILITSFHRDPLVLRVENFEATGVLGQPQTPEVPETQMFALK